MSPEILHDSSEGNSQEVTNQMAKIVFASPRDIACALCPRRGKREISHFICYLGVTRI